jgi:hypothetical protein
MNATCVPRGDQMGELRVAPVGTCTFTLRPLAGSTMTSPVRVLVVRLRARLARVSICRPPSQMCAAP